MFHELRSIHLKWHQKMKKQSANRYSIPLYCCVNIDDGFGFRDPYQTEWPFHPPNRTNQEPLWSLFMRLVFSKYYSSNEWLDPTMEVPFLFESFFLYKYPETGRKGRLSTNSKYDGTFKSCIYHLRNQGWFLQIFIPPCFARIFFRMAHLSLAASHENTYGIPTSCARTVGP